MLLSIFYGMTQTYLGQLTDKYLPDIAGLLKSNKAINATETSAIPQGSFKICDM